jgi:uncharacterized membrane protein
VLGNPRHAHRALATVALLYFITLATFALVQHAGLKTQMNDLGNMDQAVWGASHGRLAMPVTNDTDGRTRSRLGVHANFVFWLLAPLYWLWSDPRVLLLVTTLACTAAGVGIYAFARRRLGATAWALVPPIAFFASPMVHDANLYDFHIVTVFTALLVWMAWAFDAGRRRLGFALLGLALVCQEDVPLFAACFGAWLAISGQRRTGILIAVVSLAWFALLIGVISPAINHGTGLFSAAKLNDRYYWLTRSPLRPILSTALRPDRLRIPIYFLASGAIAAWRAWPMLLFLLPGVGECLLSNNEWSTQITGTYYWIIDEAILILAVTLAAAGGARGALARRGPLIYLGAATAALSLLLSPLPHGWFAHWDNYSLPRGRESLKEIVQSIPADAPLSVQNNLGPQLSQRPFIASYSRRLDEARFALFDVRYVLGRRSGLFARQQLTIVNHADSGDTVDSWLTGIAHLLRDPGWGLVAQRDGFYLFERGAPSPMPPARAWERFAAAADQFHRDFAAADRTSSWARYLVGPLRWSDVL